MSIKVVTPEDAQRLLASGASLIDVRDADEHARERIDGAQLAPLATIERASLPARGGPLIFHCRSGARTQMNAARLAACAGGEAYILEGGLEGWKRAGLPLIVDRKQPLEIMRQVQIVAGVLVLAGVTLGATLAPAFYALAGFVGAGLTFAGVTGACFMARVLRKMPWNRSVAVTR